MTFDFDSLSDDDIRRILMRFRSLASSLRAATSQLSYLTKWNHALGVAFPDLRKLPEVRREVRRVIESCEKELRLRALESHGIPIRSRRK